MNGNDKEIRKRTRYNSPMAYLPIIAGIILNFLGSKLAAASGLPVYLDSIGTIFAAVLGGYLPGVMTAVVNNIINYALDPNSIYYASISTLIAITATYLYKGVRRGGFLRMARLIVIAALIGVLERRLAASDRR